MRELTALANSTANASKDTFQSKFKEYRKLIDNNQLIQARKNNKGMSIPIISEKEIIFLRKQFGNNIVTDKGLIREEGILSHYKERKLPKIFYHGTKSKEAFDSIQEKGFNLSKTNSSRASSKIDYGLT